MRHPTLQARDGAAGASDASSTKLRRAVDDDWRRQPEDLPEARQRAERSRPRRHVRYR